MKSKEIKKSALIQYVQKGYEATTLDDIVESIGIKKQSVYSHFKHKEEIFLEVVKDVVAEEINFINKFFEKHEKSETKEVLFHLLTKYKERYLHQEEANIKFLLRIAFIPPYHLQDFVINQFHLYNNELVYHVNKVFSHSKDIVVTAEEGTVSFMNFLDGILVELIYSNISEFDKRLNISWKIYWKGISTK